MMVHTLPKQSTPFVGRTTEISEISDLLARSDCRLLSLIGPSGMGKTRLALEIATQQQDQFTDGVYFVALQPLISADTVISAIASALKFDSYDEDINLQELLLDYLSNKNLLLLMDNFEHVLEGAELVAHILMTAPQVKFLVTSREALKLQQEWVHPVVGMLYPDTLDVSEIGDYSAIQLFIERAQQFRRNLNLEEELPHIIRICQLVGGMPLGIELAVAWLKTLSCAEVATEIARNSDLLTAQMRDIEARHQSIRTIFDSTWEMLTADEQAIFMRLSIFRGTPTRQAIQTVTGAGLLGLSGLVDKALLISTDNGRYQIHALLRQYAFEKLEASQEYDTIRQAHSKYYLCFLHERQADIYGRRQIEAVEEITDDFENIRVAWNWALDVMNYEYIGLAVETLCSYLHFRSQWQQESHMLIDAQKRFAPAEGEAPHPVWAMIIARNFSNSDHPVDDLKLALEIAKATDNRGEIGLILHLMAHQCGGKQGDPEAIQHLEKAIPYFEEVGNDYHLAASYGYLAMNYRLFGDYNTSLALNEKYLTMSRAMGNIDGQTFATSELADTMFIVGKLQDAENYRHEALLLAKQIGRLWNIAWIKLELAIYHNFGIASDLDVANQLIKDVERFSDDTKWKLLIELSKTLILAIDEEYDGGHDLVDQANHLITYDSWFPIIMWNQLMVTSGQQDYEAVSDLTYKLLDYYSERRAIPYLMLGIAFASISYAYRDNNWQRATQLLSLASTHPSSMTGWLKRWALIDRLQGDMEHALGVTQFQAQWDIGTSLDWEQVVNQLISELEQSESTSANDDTIQAHILSANLELPEPLSERELEVLLKITEGYSNKEIAEQLYVGVSTVKKHITHIYGKLEVESRTQAILRAQELTIA